MSSSIIVKFLWGNPCSRKLSADAVSSKGTKSRVKIGKKVYILASSPDNTSNPHRRQQSPTETVVKHPLEHETEGKGNLAAQQLNTCKMQTSSNELPKITSKEPKQKTEKINNNLKISQKLKLNQDLSQKANDIKESDHRKGFPELLNTAKELSSAKSVEPTISEKSTRSVLDIIANFPLHNSLDTKQFVPKVKVQNFIHLSNGDINGPYVTQVLNQTRTPESTQKLAQWEKRMIAQLGLDGFQEYKKCVLQDGIDFHKSIQEYLINGEDVMSDNNPVLEACWKSLRPVLKNIDNVLCTESKTVHPQLMYKGYIDCIATYKSKPVLIEWKKASRSKSRIEFTYDDPIQALAYLGAVNFDPSYTFQIKDCLLVFAYTDGSPADVHFISSEQAQFFWQKWLEKLRQYLVKLEGDISHTHGKSSQVSYQPMEQPSEQKTPSSQTTSKCVSLDLGQTDLSSFKSSNLETKTNCPVNDSSSTTPVPHLLNRVTADASVPQTVKEKSGPNLNPIVKQNDNKKVCESPKPEGILKKFLKLWKF